MSISDWSSDVCSSDLRTARAIAAIEDSAKGDGMGEIAAAAPADHPALIETLAQAFQTDPALSCILPDPHHRARALRGLFRTLDPADIRAGIDRKSVVVGKGVSVLLIPGCPRNI